jgi:Amt family ammonium transporter
MMTIPGVALFYGGMVRKKNLMATLMQSFVITAAISVVWIVIGYSLAFSSGGGSSVGNLDMMFLKDLDVGGGDGIPDSLFIIFQMTFTIITSALITGAVAERMKFSSLLVFTVLWSIIVYPPITYWLWSGGFGRHRRTCGHYSGVRGPSRCLGHRRDRWLGVLLGRNIPEAHVRL